MGAVGEERGAVGPVVPGGEGEHFYFGVGFEEELFGVLGGAAEGGGGVAFQDREPGISARLEAVGGAAARGRVEADRNVGNVTDAPVSRVVVPGVIIGGAR